jgi:thiol-disulfide isomerase/thioredoxin
MLQIAIAEEFSGNEDSAIEWYEKILASKADELTMRKATGARRRLTGVGKPLSLQGSTADGRKLDLKQLKGRLVLVHYWATWCEPCKDDIKKLDKLVAEYGGKFVPVGINVDTDEQLLTEFLRRNRLSWPQIHEEGGLDSRLAVDLGILTVPTMILIDEEGNVVNRNVLISEVEDYLSKKIR